MASRCCRQEFVRPSSSSSEHFGVPSVDTAKAFLLASKGNTVCSFFVVNRSVGFLPVACLAIPATLVAILLPSIARIVLPLVHFGFVVLMPRIWNGFLSWLTPSYLFLLLNCIIIILAVTSGILKNSNRSSEFYADRVVGMESHQQRCQYTEPALKQRQQHLQHRESSVRKQHVREQQVVPHINGRVFKANISETMTPAGRFIRGAADKIGTDSRSSYKNHIRRSEPLGASVASKSSFEERSPSSSSLIVVEVPPVDKLSDEDLKRRMDDFIAKFNAQIRMESRRSYEY